MTDLHNYTEQNRRAWDEIAEERHRASFPAAAFFAEGGSVLEDVVTAAAGDVYGLRILHLQCSTGSDTISWAVLGAEATGVDISPRQIEIAQRTADEAALPVHFVAADVYALPVELQREEFDIVFTGGGAIVWLPDLGRWAQIVAASLRPGGRLILHDEHPLASCIWIENGELIIGDDYFARHHPHEGPGWAHFAGGENAQENKYEFNWPLGDVITALAQAGLVIERLEEYPSTAEWRFGAKLHEAARLPGQYLLIARKR
ncbi:MAG: class I SAM-dependent methyltransferase [Caldilineaceae bacterium]|nr:class I SAM-dependent methyltransferase [Caldilineaceae bacterium]